MAFLPRFLQWNLGSRKGVALLSKGRRGVKPRKEGSSVGKGVACLPAFSWGAAAVFPHLGGQVVQMREEGLEGVAEKWRARG